MSKFPVVIKPDSITVFIKGKPYTMASTDKQYQIVKTAIKEGWEEGKIIPLFDKKEAILKVNENRSPDNSLIRVDNGQVFFITMNGEKPLSGGIVDRIIFMHSEGFDLKPIELFLERLYKNPSYRAVQELFQFLDYLNIPIAPNGCFRAYKRLNKNWTDCHTGKINNSIGTVVKMPRNEVDDNHNNGCSRGLHAGSKEYFSTGFGSDGRMVVVEIDPMNVVSVPTDCNFSKLRCCEYKVIEEVINVNDFALPEYYDDRSFDDEDEEDDDYDE